jgi:hypothetical protein
MMVKKKQKMEKMMVKKKLVQKIWKNDKVDKRKIELYKHVPLIFYFIFPFSERKGIRSINTLKFVGLRKPIRIQYALNE